MWYLYRLLAHRPDFATTMSESEAAVMAEHADYWSAHIDTGRVLIFSPVADPDGVWGMAVVHAASPDEMADLAAADPAVRKGIADSDFLQLLMPVVSETNERQAVTAVANR